MNADSSRTPTGALVLNAGVLLLPLALGLWFATAIKAVNPDDVDVSAGLAYLLPILVVSWVLIGVFLIAALVANVMVQRTRGASAARPLWIVLATQLVAGVVILLAQLAERGITGA